jgi:hypothetical protein
VVVAVYVYFPLVRASPIRQLGRGESLVWDAERRKWFLAFSLLLSCSVVRECE